MWEYNITVLTEVKKGIMGEKEKEIHIKDLSSPETRAEVIAHLNVEGRDLWELINAIPSSLGDTVICFWKRKKTEKGE